MNQGTLPPPGPVWSQNSMELICISGILASVSKFHQVSVF